MKRAAFVLALTGCGRLGFDHLDVAGDGGADARGDGAVTDGAIDAALDPSLQLYVPFELTFGDYAKGRPVGCMTCPALVPGRGGTVGAFTGGQCLRVANDVPFNVQRLTIALWVRPNAAGTMALFGKPYMQATQSENSWQVFLNNGALVFGTRETVLSDFQSGAPVGLSTWHHIAATFDSGIKQNFVDGAPAPSTANNLIAYDTGMITIGCDTDANVDTAFFTGELDEVRFYDRVLSQAEITVLAQ